MWEGVCKACGKRVRYKWPLDPCYCDDPACESEVLSDDFDADELGLDPEEEYD